jgi:hypothetical protein
MRKSRQLNRNIAGSKGTRLGKEVHISVLQHITELRNSIIATSAAGLVSSTVAIQPTTLIAAARLAGYQVLADEIRIDSVTYAFDPLLGSTAGGRLALYIERDPAAAAVASVSSAMDQREVVHGNVRTGLNITWHPQEPNDRQYNLLNPGTTSLGSFILLGDLMTDSGTLLPIGTSIGTLATTIKFTIRGRP